jgi:hypothetical protein
MSYTQAKEPRGMRDLTPIWQKLEPIGALNGTVRVAIDAFCERKGISFAALEELGARYAAHRGRVCLAFAGWNAEGIAVTAIKYRPTDGSSHETEAELGSKWVRPNVLGRRDTLDWVIAEGETDGARLFDLVGTFAAVLVLPTGAAAAFRREWVDIIPRGATVLLCHDADEEGDAGAEKAARIIGGKTRRIRPPAADWCEWEGERDDFLALLKDAHSPRFEFASLDDFLTHDFPDPEALLGEPGVIFLARGSLFMVYGADGSAKSTWTIDGIAHLAAGVDWLGIPVPRPVRFCVIENEGPPGLFQQKLAAKIESWQGPAFRANVCLFKGPWGEFSFADAEAREALVAFCDEYEIDVVTANPTLGLGVAASGRPDETQAFVDWLVECGLKSERAFWLLHHENKSGQISGDWGRHPDTKVALQQDGNQPRTKLDWAKTRWATLPSETIPKLCLLEWIIETQGYTVTQLDSVGASDAELEERIADYLAEHPWASTRSVIGHVTGTQSRIRELLNGERFDCVRGPRGSLLWNLTSDRVVEDDDTPTQ